MQPQQSESEISERSDSRDHFLMSRSHEPANKAQVCQRLIPTQSHISTRDEHVIAHGDAHPVVGSLSDQFLSRLLMPWHHHQ
jgi:hypothetical protein